MCSELPGCFGCISSKIGAEQQQNTAYVSIEMKPKKNAEKIKVSFAERVCVFNHQDLVVQANFNNKPSISKKASIPYDGKMSGDEIRKKLGHQTQSPASPSTKRKEGESVAIQLEKQGVVWKNYDCKLTLSQLKRRKRINCQKICGTVDQFLYGKVDTEEGMFRVLSVLKKTLSEAEENPSSSIETIKNGFVNALKQNHDKEMIDKEMFRFLLSQESYGKLTHFTAAPEYYQLYLANRKKLGTEGAWEAGQEREITIPHIAPKLLDKYLAAIEELFHNDDFKTILNSFLMQSSASDL